MLLELPAEGLDALLDDWLPDWGVLCEGELLEEEELLEDEELLEGIWAEGGSLLEEVVLQPLSGASSTTTSIPTGA